MMQIDSKRTSSWSGDNYIHFQLTLNYHLKVCEKYLLAELTDRIDLYF